MATPLIPWEPSHVPLEIQQEIDRRRQNISLNFEKPTTGWESGDWKKYKGPMAAWARVCSNGAGPTTIGSDGTAHPIHPRFVLFGGKEFISTYGFKTTSGTSANSQIIGYMPNGIPHVIENERTSQYPVHVPAPEVSRIDMTIQKEVLRRAVVEWTCFSWKQLEYMTPYFLVPGITVMIELGWNHFNPESLVNIEDEKTMTDLWDHPYPLYKDKIIKSRGNYDVIYGLITNFNWSVEGNNRYICTTEITSKNRLYAGLPIASEVFIRSNNEHTETQFKTLGNISEFLSTDNVVMNFCQVARFGPKHYIQASKGATVEEKVTEAPAGVGISAGGIGSSFGTRKATKTVNVTKFEFALSRRFTTFFLDVYNKTRSMTDKEKRNLKLSYLYAAFDGRGNFEKTYANDFDNDKKQAWFSMGLLSTILNAFSERTSMNSDTPMFELDIDDTLISAHDNFISPDSNVMIVPNSKNPKYFWGKEGFGPTEFEYTYQYVDSVEKENQTLADKTLAKLFRMPSSKAARDDVDVWINRNIYRLNPEAEFFAPEENYDVPKKGSRSFPNHSTNEIKPVGYLRDIYINVNCFISLIEEITKGGKSYYDLIQSLLNKLNDASAGLWDLSLINSERDGSWTIADRNFSSTRNSSQQKEVLIFDMHDSNNIVKTFKFRPQLTDAQTNRVLYGEASNPTSQVYSKDEIESLDWEFKDLFLKNTAEGKNKSYPSQAERFENLWARVLKDIQVINQPSQATCQMTIYREDYPAIESKTGKSYRYIKLALPANNGISILRKLLDDNDYINNSKYCAIQPGINAEITMQGLGGLRTFQCFLIRNLPLPYSSNKIVFQIINVIDHLEGGNWETTIIAGIRPLRSYLRDTLRLTDVT